MVLKSVWPHNVCVRLHGHMAHGAGRPGRLPFAHKTARRPFIAKVHLLLLACTFVYLHAKTTRNCMNAEITKSF